jgi:hypothetical protein
LAEMGWSSSACSSCSSSDPKSAPAPSAMCAEG